MRPLPTLAAAALLATLAAPTHAEPTLPTGWIAGGPAARMTDEAAPSPRSREALQRSSQPPRPVLDPVTLPLDAFDTVDTTPMPSWQDILASNAEPAGEAPTDLFIDRTCSRASVSGHEIGLIDMGMGELPTGPQSEGGVIVAFSWSGKRGDGKHLFSRAHWESIDRLPDGTLRFTETVARFNVLTCKSKVASRYTAVARPLFGGLAFVFRTHCAACEARGRDVLHVLMPSNGWGSAPYSHSTVRIGGDEADSLRARISRARVQEFAKVVKRALPAPPDGADRLLGIEATKARGEAAPYLLAYTTEARHVGF